MRRSGNSASVGGGKNRSDLRGRWLARGGGRRHIAVRAIVPGLEGRLDERRQRDRLLRPAVSAVAVAEAAPATAAESPAHHLAHSVAAPAALSPQQRQAEPEPAQHRQFPIPIFCVVHLVLLHRLTRLLSLILPPACERPVKEPGPRCGERGRNDRQLSQRGGTLPLTRSSRRQWDPETIRRRPGVREASWRYASRRPSIGPIRSDT